MSELEAAERYYEAELARLRAEVERLTRELGKYRMVLEGARNDLELTRKERDEAREDARQDGNRLGVTVARHNEERDRFETDRVWWQGVAEKESAENDTLRARLDAAEERVKALEEALALWKARAEKAECYELALRDEVALYRPLAEWLAYGSGTQQDVREFIEERDRLEAEEK